MPVSTYNKKHLMGLLGFKISEKELARNIENLGLVIKREGEKEWDIEFKANRPDIISAVGLARAIRYFMRRSRSFTYDTEGEKEGFEISVGSNVLKIRPFIAAIVVENAKMGEDDLLDLISFTEKISENYGRRRKRIAIGLHDLKSVKPPLQYDAYEDEVFVPLGRRAGMKFSEVLKKEEKGVKYGALLGETARRYVALKDAEGTMALIPIINSTRTRVTTSTTSMLVDITGPTRRIIERVADMLAANFMDMGCDVYSVRIRYAGEAARTPGMESPTVSVPLEQIEREIGVKVGFNNVILLANKMGYEASLVGRSVRFRVPAYRLDYINEQDIIEDIAIAYGYDYIRPAAVPSTAVGVPDTRIATNAIISEAMVGLGYGEMFNSYLTNERKNFGLMGIKEKDSIKLSNPKTEVATMMRTWLVPSLLECLGKSAHDRMPQRMFELDLAFALRGGKPVEEYRLAAVSCGAKANFNDMKADVEAMGRVLGIEFGVKAAAHESFIDGRCAQVTLDGRKVGLFGEVHPRVTVEFGIEEPVLAMEIELGLID
jgi:phenylalanyl-tRNA synthetase beta chain